MQNEAALRRLPPNYEKVPLIEADLKKRKAGYYGEKRVDYHLSFLNDKKYMIFHDIRLPLNPHYFQIDTLVVTPHYALIIEVKNLTGIMRIDPQIRQCTRIYNDKTEGFIDPVSQVTRQKLLLQKWFLVNKLKAPPIDFLVVISNPATILEYTTLPKPLSSYLKIIHSQNLIDRIMDLNSQFSSKMVSDIDIAKIKRAILKNHSSQEYNFLEKLNIPKEAILRGVQCKKCNFIPLQRVSSSWFCSKCSSFSDQDAIEDYLLLIDNKHTNRDLRWFLNLESQKIATKILKSSNLLSSGTLKGTTYSRGRVT